MTYIPFSPYLLLICQVPLLLYWIRTPSLMKTFFGGWISQLILSLIGFHWIQETAVSFGHLPRAIGLLALLAFALFIHLHIPIAGLIWNGLRRRFVFGPVTGPLSLGLIWGLSENLYPMIFPWHLGYTTLWAKFFWFKSADIWGFQGISVFVSVIAASLAWTVDAILRGEETFRRSLSLAVGTVALISAVSLAPRKIPPSTDMRILLVQANIGNYDKYLAERVKDVRPPILEKYAKLTDQALREHGPVDLIVWPETAISDNMDEVFLGGPFQQSVLNHVKRWNTRLISGSYSEDAQLKVYNAIINISPQGVVQQMYKKRHLLAFGEYFPGAETFPILKKLVPAVSDFGAGKEDVIFVTEKARIALQICYEGLYPSLTRASVLKGADAIVNVTNDSWFGQTFEPFQHLTMTMARAVEFQIPLVRSTNTGLSTSADPNGQFALDSPLHKEWATVETVRVPGAQSPTLFAKLLPWLNWILFGFLLIAILTTLLPRSRARP